LKNAKLLTVGDVRKVSDAVLLRVPDLGKRTLREIREVCGVYEEPRDDCPVSPTVHNLLADMIRREFDSQLPTLERYKNRPLLDQHQGSIAEKKVDALYDRVCLLANHYDDTCRPTKWFQYRKKLGWKTHHWGGGDG
jgi:hypothetical protein